MSNSVYLKLGIILAGVLLWFAPVPTGLTVQAWHLFAIFITAITIVIFNALSIFTSSILAITVAVLTGTLEAKDAFSGFSQGFIILIIVAFLLAKGVINSGLGRRIAFLIISRFGKSSLGLAYSVIAADIIIAPGFPSNTARSGVLFPIVNALAEDSGSRVDDGTRKKIGAFLMMSSMAGLTISSALWLTAMAANPAGVAMAKDLGVDITYFSWVIAASVPVLVLFFLMPWVIYKVFPPEMKATPQAPVAARAELEKMGPLSRNEWITALTFVGVVGLWVASSFIDIDKTIVALGGLAVLMMFNVYTVDDLKKEGGALEIYIWFGFLFTLSVFLNKFGFMGWLGGHVTEQVTGLDWPAAYAILVCTYILIHYFFVSQTAHMLALFGVFLKVGLALGVPGEMLALMLLFATNFNAIITPQGSSANVIYIASGYINAREVYSIGGIVTLINTIVFLTLGSVWIRLVL